MPNNPACSTPARRFSLAFTASIVIAILSAAHINSGGAAQTEGGTIIGVVQDDHSMPVAGVRVTISSADFSSWVLTQTDGKFEFKNLKPAQYRITAEATGFRKERISLPITRPEDVSNPIIIRLTPSSLHVAVFDANNQPLGGVKVTLYTQDRAVARAKTDEGGDAYFGSLTPGSYQLTADLPGYDEGRDDLVPISPGMTTEVPLKLFVAPVIPINDKAVVRKRMPDLPSKNVRSIFEDSHGWIWLGTDKGVARFNGSDFKSSATNGSSYEPLAGEDVRSIAEDPSGTIWLATARGARRITKGGEDIGRVLDGYDVRHLSVDSHGNVWVATASGLFKHDGKDFTSIDQSHGLPSNDVRAVAEDKRERIWIVTAAGLVILEEGRIIPLEEILNRSASDGGETEAETRDQVRRPISRTPPRPGTNNSTESDSVRARPAATAMGDALGIFVDNAGTVWLATSKGAFLFDGNRFSSVLVNAPRDTSRSIKAAASDSGVRAISQDQTGRMWFALGSGGALLYDPVRRETQRISSLDRDEVAAIFTGREGHVWFGTNNGAVLADFYSFVNFTTSRGLSDNDVRAVVEEPANLSDGRRGRLWFVTAAGVSRMEGERFVPVERFRASTSVHAVAFDGESTAWFATERGVIRLKGQTLTPLSEDDGLASNTVHWAATVDGGSATVFATTRGASIFKGGTLRNLEGLERYDMRHVFQDNSGRLWFATSLGVVKYDPDTNQTELFDTARGLPDSDTRWITQFKDKLLVATRAGTQAYSESGGASTFTTFDGDPASTLFVDRDGYLWVGTDDGKVKKFAVVSGHIISITYSDKEHALTGSRINSISEDSEGRIWIATDKGAVRHIPIRVAPPTRVSLKVDDHTPEHAPSEPYNIPPGRHKVSFDFVAASMTGYVRYLYRINGEQGEKAWEMLPVQQGAEREVSRLDLDEGSHTFEIIALNRDLYGAERPAATLSLRVGSPFWKRWWFYTLALALIALTAATIIAAQKMRDREYVLPKELRSYVPIEPNPYIVGNPIRGEKMFYGREDDFRYVRTKLEGVSQGVVIVFCGERRVGKSSILYQVQYGRLGDRFIPVFVDMQEMVVTSDSELFTRVSRLIADAVNRANSPDAAGPPGAGNVTAGSGIAAIGAQPQTRGAQASGGRLVAVKTLGVPRFDGGNPYPLFVDFLDEALAAIGDRTLLILIDEYELMEAKVDEGKLSPELFTFLAGMMDNKERLALIFTGSRRLEERDKKYWRELLRRSLFRKVGFLSEKDTVRLITEPVTGRVVYGRGVVDAICRLTAGQPFYAQVICQNVVDYMNEHEQNWVTNADLKNVIADIVDNPLPQMIYTWDALSDDEKLVLGLLAEMLPNGNQFATAHELRASVRAKQYPVNLSENTIRLTLEEMFRRELLDKDATAGFRFKIDLLRLWIRRSHSIWQVVKEVRTL